MASGRLIPFRLPAYVLGNGPTLPVSELRRLEGQFTIGVNRILRSGFVPTVVLWNDPELWAECGQAYLDSGAMLVSNAVHMHAVPDPGCGQVHWLYTYGGATMPAPGYELKPHDLFMNGNSAVGAALWAIALGCPSVQMLGCGCVPSDGRSHFYGPHPTDWMEERYHLECDGQAILKRPLEGLLASKHKDKLLVSDDIPQRFTASWDQNYLRKILRLILEFKQGDQTEICDG